MGSPLAELHSLHSAKSSLHTRSTDSNTMDHVVIPNIGTDEPLFEVIPKLSSFISLAVGDMAYSFEQMRYGSRGQRLRQLVHTLAEDSHNPFIIVALMILKWDFTNAPEDDWGLNESRGSACEFVAWQFLCHLDQRETIDFLLEELPIPRRGSTNSVEAGRGLSGLTTPRQMEITPLLSGSSTAVSRLVLENAPGTVKPEEKASVRKPMAKRFLSQRVVQRVVNDIWNGEIVFWDSLTVNSKKNPHMFNRRTADPYSRLRVPVYRKLFEAAFFLSFLLLYYSVLVERKQNGLGFFEALMDVWIAAFAYDELSGMVDAGMLFYQMDFWSLWNLGIIGVGISFIITSEFTVLKSALPILNCARTIGLARGDDYILDMSFDILSLEALFLVPSSQILTQDPQNMLPREPELLFWQSRFLTTFTMLARDRLSLKEMSWMLVKVFFGSSALGLDSAAEISPIFGYGLMLIFVPMSNILLLSSLISLMSMSMEGVMLHAREEYLFQLSIYVLESSNSRRLTYFMPPCSHVTKNLIPLFCIRPMRLFLSAGTVRRVRIVLLRATHLPFVMLIWVYESSWRRLNRRTTGLPPLQMAGHVPAGQPSASRCQDPQHPCVAETRPGPGNERTDVEQDDVREPDSARGGQAQLADVIDAIEQLRAQVERVSRTAAQHRAE
ncbi:uncharacterized protein N7443_000171 [Penicillium atrosanguineum]|uniref:Ion transport domain-containing protein n=1 Tax=Penicillium atrosanguineum TaxID=1132637 RepID=A0A9W9QE12_9EURO|nr:uncharacterized protein N7443_000171 [Penicillium atrosanguineum]KAJ5313287.1 hypothetical protein N7443_000171 [Penicillium atrosanguineum]KAJ5330383.1 hypothetical protein N7476_000166 [Penicillium atrosanguineum]